MKFDKPETTNAIDNLTVVGQPHRRIDGPLKVSGRAPYAYEHGDIGGDVAYGFPVGSGIAKGRILSIDTDAARAAPGVLAVVTSIDFGEARKGKNNTAHLFGGDKIEHYHQAIAVVVAESFEQARSAAALIHVEYQEETGSFDLEAAKGSASPPDPDSENADTAVGNFDDAFNSAAVTLDATYETPDQSHAMMEPHASLAKWDGDQLTVWTSSQMIDWWHTDLAMVLNMDKEKIRLKSPYIGGGFGGKLFLRVDAVLAAVGAKAAGRAVKLALPRPMMMNNTTHRPATIQRIRIGADEDGKITAIGHESWSGNLPEGDLETAVMQTRLLYAGENRMTAMRLARLDLAEGNAMRAPGEAPGLMALEIAMDEMAEKLGMDPIDFRVANDTQVDPENPERPFTQRDLIGCLKLGAERFGWQARSPQPASRREGRFLIGHGVAAAFRNNLLVPSAARVRLEAGGRVVVETDMTDIGTGSYTIIAQTAAEMFGIPIEAVDVRLGDSQFPVSAGSGGQFGANCSTSGVYAACVKLREEIAKTLGFNSNDITFAGGFVRSGDRSIPLAEAAGEEGLVAEDVIEWGDLHKTHQQSTFGAHFVEVAVDAFTGEIRVRRMLAVCAAGRILNPITARSQVIGAMTMGVGLALSEELAVDTKRGFFVNHDLAGYEVPVHADIPHQDVIFLNEADPMSSPMKAKGVGELGLCGVSAAVANAIYNATGVRVRDYPITLDKLIGGLPQVA
ncbi:aldehyde oxidoreductase molybdenum-binding subunit PaoC [Peteryoungia ipomoeae]|uniref:Xanthine dehydrogenase family protein molybdopterin-binding subunit n=1 Tax=Peteryoungia ipomoeae TaxID=1210932 RepID=A0A4S8NXU3_9HYPH|nr:aldehyde oxidoreductase molybdenum-binding subunit PaoC [Peteryoungia ipomoeae]THV22298.1 xanthine dehydrogenase family protein molybdopterin-binding subunit [Peteryoungia ipomoeae]